MARSKVKPSSFSSYHIPPLSSFPTTPLTDIATTHTGLVFENIGKNPDMPLFPSIGLRCTGEAIRANFGSQPFRYAISDHVRSRRDAVWASVSGTPVDWLALARGRCAVRAADVKDREKVKDEVGAGASTSTLSLSMSASASSSASLAGTALAGDSAEEQQGIREPMKKLVLAYLAHHGYARTARAFQEQCVREKRMQGADAGGAHVKKMSVDVDPSALASAGASTSRTRLDADIDTEMEIEAHNLANPGEGWGEGDGDGEMGLDSAYTRGLHTRIAITNAILRGDVDRALVLAQTHNPGVLERDAGLVLFKMRCRKFVELALDSSVAWSRVKELEKRKSEAEEEERKKEKSTRAAMNGASSAGAKGANGATRADEDEELYADEDADADADAEAEVDGDVDGDEDGEGEMDYGVESMDEAGAMDVDDPSPEARPIASLSGPSAKAFPSPAPVHHAPTTMSAPAPSPTLDYAAQHATLLARAKSTTHLALNYGRELQTNYKKDSRALVQAHLHKTFGIVAYNDPIAEGGEIAEIAGQAARVALATEVNQAILRE